jgi:cell division septation protein DedD
MKKIYIYPIILVTFLLLSLVSSCTSSDDEDIYVLKDTVVLNVDTLIKEQRNVQRVNLSYVIQLAAFREQSHADAFILSAKEKLNSIPDLRKTNGVFLVTVGKFNEAGSAQDYLNFVKSKGFTNAFIKSLN